MSIDLRPTLQQQPRRTWRQWSKLARVRIGFVLMLIVALSLFSWWLPRWNSLAAIWGGAQVFCDQSSTQRLPMALRMNIPPAILTLFDTDDVMNVVWLDDAQVDVAWLSVMQKFPRLDQFAIPGALLCPELSCLSKHRVYIAEIHALAPESDLGQLRELPFLSELIVVNPPKSGGGLKNLREVKNLKYLSICRVERTTDCSDLFQQLAEVTQLESLSVELDHSSISADDLVPLANLPQLLMLSFIGKGTIDSRGLNHISRITSLKELELGPCQATASELQQLSKLPHLKRATINGSALDLNALRQSATE